MGKRIALIGIGNLAKYLKPNIVSIAGDQLSNCIGIKNSMSDISEKEKYFGFKIRAGDAEIYNALCLCNPDIIMFAVPPNKSKAIVSSYIKKYYMSLREQMSFSSRNDDIRLPIFLAFPPFPLNQFYYEELGPNVMCANILPNMISQIAETDCSHIGQNYVNIYSMEQWSEAGLQLLDRFLSPNGNILFVKDDEIAPLLAGKCVGNILLDLIQIVSDELKKQTLIINHHLISSIMKQVLIEEYDKKVSLPTLVQNRGKPFEERIYNKAFNIIHDIFCGWYDGILEAIIRSGISRDTAVKGTSFKLSLFLSSIESEKLEKIKESNETHATKGGVQEYANLIYEEQFKRSIHNAISGLIQSKFGYPPITPCSYTADDREFIKNKACNLTAVVSIYCYSLDK